MEAFVLIVVFFMQAKNSQLRVVLIAKLSLGFQAIINAMSFFNKNFLFLVRFKHFSIL